MDLKSLIRTIPDYPKAGILFRDVTTLFKDRRGFAACIGDFARRYEERKIDAVVGIEARGFILAGALAHALGAGFVPVRKLGKLPSATARCEYQLEYGSDTLEIHLDALHAGQRVLIIDDLIATGGTALAAVKLVQGLKAEVIECAFAISLPELKGADKLIEHGIAVYSQVEFDGA
jgi:adenine phosphoribosyltransferase